MGKYSMNNLETGVIETFSDQEMEWILETIDLDKDKIENWKNFILNKEQVVSIVEKLSRIRENPDWE